MFLNVVMLAGLGGAAVPLVLHLLARARHQTVDWGGMMFLSSRDWRRDQSARLRQWVLLGVRMLLVGLLAVALARPIVRGQWSGVGQEGRTTAVIVLDRSFSMGYEEAGRSRLDKAREAVLQILASLRTGDEVSLVLLGERVETPYRQPTSNLQVVARDVAELRVSRGMADVERGLTVARAILDQAARVNRELYLICDRQAANWRRLEQGMGAQSRNWLSSARVPTRFYWIPVGGEDKDNLAVEAVDIGDGVVVKGETTEAEVRVRNYGGTASAGTEMTLSVTAASDPPRSINETGRVLKTMPVSVGGGSTTTVRVPVVFDQVGSHVLTARIKAGGIEADNRFDRVVEVIEPVNVLIISGDEHVEEMRRESFYLRLSLTPYQMALKRGGDGAVATVKAVEEWEGIDLARFRVVILANVPQVTADQARALEQKVYEGGGLIICPGGLSRVENYNTVLYRNGQGLMPGRLEAATPADGSRATSLLGLELTHPVFRFRRGSDPLPGAVVGRYFPATVRQADARVLGTYGSGEPFLVEGARGRGRVLLVTTPLDADWNTLPLQPFFLPFVQSAVRYVGAGQVARRDLVRGEALVATFDEGLDDRRVTLTRDDERAIELMVSPGRSEVTYLDTEQPGIYRVVANVKGKGRKVAHFVVQSSPEESDLSPLNDGQVAQLRKAMGFGVVDPAGGPITGMLAKEREGRELWLYALGAVILVGLGEMWLARRWSQEVI